MLTGRCPLRWLTLITIMCSLIWMDTCLYLKIQSYEDKDKHHDKYDDDLYEQQTFNISSNALGPLGRLASKFSFVFHGISIKLMMTDPIDNYIMGPLSEVFSNFCDFKHNLLFVSANMVSYAGVISALIAAKLVSYDSPSMHKLSYLFFQLRTWLDDLDGEVARSRSGIYKHVSMTGTPGYVIDGVCDTIGFAAYIIGCYVYLRNNVTRSQQQRHIYADRSQRFLSDSLMQVRSTTSDNDQSCYAPLRHQNDQTNYFTVEDESDCDSYLENDQEQEVEILMASDSSGQVSPLASDGKLDIDSSPETSLNPHRAQVSRTKLLMENDVHSPHLKRANMVLYQFLKNNIKKGLSNRRLLLLVVCFSLQLSLCSFFWNRYILVYRDLLETPSSNILQAKGKRKILKSNIMYFLLWFWRLTNGHMFMQLFAAAIFLGKVLEFLELIKLVGFVEIIVLTIGTELHSRDVIKYLDDLR